MLSPYRRTSILVAAALVLAAGACSQSPPFFSDREITAAVDQTHVWNNFMPNARASCHALMTVRLVNLTDSAVVLQHPEGLLVYTFNDQPLRRFTAVMLDNDRKISELTLPVRDTITVTFRTPDTGLDPVDFSIYRELRLEFAAGTADGRILHIAGRPVVGFTTQ